MTVDKNTAGSSKGKVLLTGELAMNDTLSTMSFWFR